MFQYLSIAPMRGLGLRAGLVAALRADTLSISSYLRSIGVSMADGLPDVHATYGVPGETEHPADLTGTGKASVAQRPA